MLVFSVFFLYLVQDTSLGNGAAYVCGRSSHLN